MKITIIKADNFVSVDGQQKEMDLTFLPDDFHALQFDGQNGSVESTDIDKCQSFDSITKWEGWQTFEKKLASATDFIPLEVEESIEEEFEPYVRTEEEIWQDFILLRNRRLEETDFVIIRAYENNLTIDTAISKYRQELRDLPSTVEAGQISKPKTEADLESFSWPIKPQL